MLHAGVCGHAQRAVARLDRGNGRRGVDLGALSREDLAHPGAERGVDRGQDLAEPLDDRHGQASRLQRLGHLEPDVAGPDDQRRPGITLGELRVEREGVGHVMERVHAR